MADIKTQTDTVFLEPVTASHHFLLHLPPPIYLHISLPSIVPPLPLPTPSYTIPAPVRKGGSQKEEGW